VTRAERLAFSLWSLAARACWWPTVVAWRLGWRYDRGLFDRAVDAIRGAHGRLGDFWVRRGLWPCDARPGDYATLSENPPCVDAGDESNQLLTVRRADGTPITVVWTSDLLSSWPAKRAGQLVDEGRRRMDAEVSR
jgi:hypothetical protein